MQTNLDTNIFFQLLVSPQTRYRVTRHLIMWLTVEWAIYRGFRYLAATYTDPSLQRQYTLLSTLLFGSLTIAGYLSITWLTQRFILRRFQVSLFLGGVLLVHIITAELVLVHFELFIQTFTLANLPRVYVNNAQHIAQVKVWQAPFDSVVVGLFSFSLFYNYMLFAVGLKIFKDFFTLRIRQAELEKENIQLEYNFLKAQINPHFLFNTLYNIYSYSLKSPAKVSDTILKLADLMRYSLYETEEEFVALAKELTFLNSYVQLERIRHDANEEISYTIQGQPNQLLIPPLILIVFVENAFKHGVQASASHSWVHIEFVIEQTRLTFRVANSLPANPKPSAGGIGLKNARRRLDHFFSERYQLQIDQQTDLFRVELIIDLREPAL